MRFSVQTLGNAGSIKSHKDDWHVAKSRTDAGTPRVAVGVNWGRSWSSWRLQMPWAPFYWRCVHYNWNSVNIWANFHPNSYKSITTKFSHVLCCRAKSNIWCDLVKRRLNSSKTKFPSNVNCEWKIITETDARCRCNERGVYDDLQAGSRFFSFITRMLACSPSRAGQNGRHFADDIFICIFVNEKCRILIKISLKFIPNGPIHINPALV